MVEQENKVILRFGTDKAVASIAELKQNISELKKELDKLPIAGDDYKKVLAQLNENQHALKDAMHATKSSFEEISAAAKGANVAFDENNDLVSKENVSYNALVHTMANLKEEWRSTTDATKRKDLGEQINSVNTALKDFDESVGSYVRNVGNYKSALDGLHQVNANLPGSMNNVKKSTDHLDKSMALMSTNPIIGIVALLSPVINGIASALKDNETAMNAVNGAMKAAQPIMDFLSGVLEKIAGVLADVIGKVVGFIGSNGLFQKIIQGVVGVGNAIIKFVVAPFKGVIAAIKVFKDQGVKGIRDASKAFKDEFTKGTAFKQNYEAGQAWAESIAAGAKSKKNEVDKAGDEMLKKAREIAKALEEGGKTEIEKLREKYEEELALLKKYHMDTTALTKKYYADVAKIREDAAAKRYEEQAKEDDETTAMLEKINDDIEAQVAATIEAVDKEQEYMQQMRQKDLEEAQKAAEQKISVIYGTLDATTAIMSTLASLYEQNAEENDKAAERSKALQIAAATIETLSGAVSAFMSVWRTPEMTATQKAILAPIQSAAVIAAGMAQIASIRKVSATGTAATTATSSVSAVASAPAVSTEVQQVRNVTTATEDERINNLSTDRKVYLVASELQAFQGDQKVRVQEATF